MNYRKQVLACALFSISIVSSQPACADAYIKKENYSDIITIHADIDEGDAEIVERLFREAIENNSGIMLSLQANIGGSVPDALKIGRMARALDIVVTSAQECYSSCALIFFGASNRLFFGGEIGIHRPYFATNVDTAKPNEEEIEYLFADVRDYLLEVRAPSFLFEQMISTPPENMRIYSDEEEIEALFGSRDPVLDEIINIEGAAKYAISMQQYLTVDKMNYWEVCAANESDINRIGNCVSGRAAAAYWGFPEEMWPQVKRMEEEATSICKLTPNETEELRKIARERKLQSLESLSSKYVRSLRNEPLAYKSRDCVVRIMRANR